MSDRVEQLLRVFLIAGLLLWGGYTLIFYVGAPIHTSVLIAESAKSAVQEACPADSGNELCRGFTALVPFILNTFVRMSVFLWYAVLCALVYVGWFVLRWVWDGHAHIRVVLTPWKILLGSLVLLWMAFTAISFADNGQTQFRRIFDPVPQVYTGVGEEGLQRLKENFDALQSRGCLTLRGRTNHGANYYDVTVSCMQASFFTRVMPHVLFLLLVVAEFLVLGGTLLGFVLRRTDMSALSRTVFSAGLGVGGWIALLWLLGVVARTVGFPLYNATAGWALFIAVPVLCYRETLRLARKFIGSRFETGIEPASLAVPLLWLLVSYLAFNFLSVLRPFPIGWDDLGSYVNRPRLMVSYGHFIPNMATFQWEYLTTLGFLLFGYDSMFGAISSLLINWTEGLLAVAAIYVFVQHFLGGAGALAALLYYALPLVGHFSFADMKVDNAVFSMGALSTFAAFLALFPREKESDESDKRQAISGKLRLMLLAGIFAGLGFGMKATAIMVLMSLIAILFGASGGRMGFLGAVLVACGVYARNGQQFVVDAVTRITGDSVVVSPQTFSLLCFIVGGGLLLMTFIDKRATAKRAFQSLGLLIAGFAVALAPWTLYNNIQYGNVLPRLVLTAPNFISPLIEIGKGPPPSSIGQDVRILPPELAVDTSSPACTSTAKTEELDRYWGFGKGWAHYLKLPWRTVMNIDSVGYYVTTMPALLLFPLVFLLPYVWTAAGGWLLWLTAGTLFMLLQWMFLANGIPWYGVGVFFGLSVGLAALSVKGPDRVSRILASILLALSLLTCFAMRFWQYENMRNLYEFTIGKITAEALQERTIPHYDDIRDIVEERARTMPDRPYLFRAGTFIAYFLPRNLERMPIADNQLELFKCISQEGNPELTTKRLSALGFNSIVFDTNTHTIERDPNGTLHQKVQKFLDYVNNPASGVRVVINDPGAGVAFMLLP